MRRWAARLQWAVLLCLQKEAILTTIGVLEEPLGNARLHGARLMAALLHTNTPSINQELCRLDTMGLLLVSRRCRRLLPAPHTSGHSWQTPQGRACRRQAAACSPRGHLTLVSLWERPPHSTDTPSGPEGAPAV